jgi:CheY-like chemotaxis protein
MNVTPWLIVEDESVIGMLIEDALADVGLTTIGPISRVPEALALIERQPLAGAVLDVNIAGTPVYPVADALLARKIPFLFVTGYGEAGRPAHLKNVRVLTKPFIAGDLCNAVLALSRQRPAL